MKKIFLIAIMLMLLVSCSTSEIIDTVKNYVPIEKLSVFNDIKDLIGELDEVKDVNLDGKEVDFSFKILGKDVKVIQPYVVIDDTVYGGEAAYEIYRLLKEQVNGSSFVLMFEDMAASKIELISGSKTIELQKTRDEFLTHFTDNDIIKEPIIKKEDVATYFVITNKGETLTVVVNPNGKTYTLYDNEGNYTNYKSDTNIIDFINKIITEENE